ncbi:MAG TPA: glucokinase [Gemmatimonadales bacterium]|nr:glucokinase [Gemmatimonadales bacterium]
MIVLAADVGGTNARLALVDLDGRTARITREHRYPSRDYPGLAPIVRHFSEQAPGRPARACLAIACTLVGDDCTAPNLPWTINARRLAADIGIPRTTIINDFAAVGYGIELLGPADLATLQEGTTEPQGPIALIGAGTGLGEGLLVWERDHYRVLPSEGGHADFASRGRLQAGLLQSLEGQFKRVSWERLLSGGGIVNIYRYLLASGVAPEQAAVRTEMEQEDPAAVVVRHGLGGTDRLSQQALDLFCDVFGAQAGNLALTVVATGGVYLGGGIAPRLVERLKSGPFLTAFRDKGRLSGLLSRIPVHVILNPNVGLLGAAAVAARMD